MSEQYHNAIDIENWNRLPDAMKRNQINTYIEMCNKLNYLFAMEEFHRPPLPLIVSVDDDGVTHFSIERIPEINASNPISEQIQVLEKEVLDYFHQSGESKCTVTMVAKSGDTEAWREDFVCRNPLPEDT